MITYQQIANCYSILGACYWSIDAGPKQIAETTKRLAGYEPKNIMIAARKLADAARYNFIAPTVDDWINEIKKLEPEKEKDNMTLMMSETAKRLKELAEKRKAENGASGR